MAAAEPQHCGRHLAGGRGDSSHCLSRRPQGLSPSGLSTVAGALHDSLFVTAVALALSAADSLPAALRFFVSVGGITARCLLSSSASWSYSLSLARVSVPFTVRDGSCSCSQRGRLAAGCSSLFRLGRRHHGSLPFVLVCILELLAVSRSGHSVFHCS